MLERVAAEAGASLPQADSDAVVHALETSLAHRDALVEDDHDPRYLHPARTLRILLADTDCRSTPALIAAAFLDTLDPDLAPPVPDTGDIFARAETLLRAVPRPGEDVAGTVESLVTAPPDAAVVALAEWLDQVRHLHVRDRVRDLHLRSGRTWESHIHDVRAAWVPVAQRLAPLLARRFARWADASERRLLLERRTGLP
jgi:hypothetical protein